MDGDRPWYVRRLQQWLAARSGAILILPSRVDRCLQDSRSVLCAEWFGINTERRPTYGTRGLASMQDHFKADRWTMALPRPLDRGKPLGTQASGVIHQ